MLPQARWARGGILVGMLGQSLFVLGFALPYETYASGQQRWFLDLTPNNLVRTLHRGDFSVAFWLLLMLAPLVLYLVILLGLNRAADRRGLLLTSTTLISVLTFLAAAFLAVIDLYILFFNAPPLRYVPPVPPVTYSPTFFAPLLGTSLSLVSSLFLLGLFIAARPSRQQVHS
jgi:hypothetical protein